METVAPFYKYLKKFVELSEQEFRENIFPIIKVRKFAKKNIITESGKVENYFNFILKGLVRKYYKRYENSHEEINTQISMENHIILSQESFHSRQLSEYIIEAIEPTVLVSIHYDDLEKMFTRSHKMEHLGRMVITFAMVIKDRWQMQQVKMTPRERFIDFVTKNPKMLQRVPQKYLASFLSIKPETFSRFKHLLVHHLKKNENHPNKH
ncbi:MAG: Crp/Fnr family transcriptional regulator [Bacteroidetes bacterium]|nr:Crp/Fnr family transcriptional regulator [Bacteroidota bacterium]MBS1931154.1 Crp/Fnr family transcriptional regulator [Bacteroidota bacterium]